MSSLVKEFSVALQEEILKLGFKKQERDIFILPINEEVCGWIGINSGTQHGGIDLNPIIGITHRTIQTINDRLCEKEKKYTKYIYPIVGQPLRYLSDKQYSPEWVEKPEDIPIEVQRIIDFVISHAIPFIKKNADLKSMLDLMFQHYGHPHQTRYYIPISYYLLGMPEKALEYTESKIKEMEGKTYPAAEDYRKFYKNFVIYMNEGKLPEIKN